MNKQKEPQEALDFQKNKQMETFSFSPPMNLSGERKLLPAVTYFEATNSVFNITDENNSFSIGTPDYWSVPDFSPDGYIDKLKIF